MGHRCFFHRCTILSHKLSWGSDLLSIWICYLRFNSLTNGGAVGGECIDLCALLRLQPFHTIGGRPEGGGTLICALFLLHNWGEAREECCYEIWGNRCFSHRCFIEVTILLHNLSGIWIHN